MRITFFIEVFKIDWFLLKMTDTVCDLSVGKFIMCLSDVHVFYVKFIFLFYIFLNASNIECSKMKHIQKKEDTLVEAPLPVNFVKKIEESIFLELYINHIKYVKEMVIHKLYLIKWTKSKPNRNQNLYHKFYNGYSIFKINR